MEDHLQLMKWYGRIGMLVLIYKFKNAKITKEMANRFLFIIFSR